MVTALVRRVGVAGATSLAHLLIMDSVDDIRRKSLQAAVAALCVEVGYMTADRGAIETLTQLLQSCMI